MQEFTKNTWGLRDAWRVEERGGREGVWEEKRGRKGWERRVKRCCRLYLEALGEVRVHAIRTASHAEGEGRRGGGGGGSEVGYGGWMSKEWEREREREKSGGGREEGERGGRLNHRDRERVRGSVLDVCSSRMNDETTTDPLSASLEDFNWILQPL